MNHIAIFLKNRFHVFMLAIVLVGLVLVLNRFSFRWDLTRNKIYTLSEVSKSLVRDLKDPLRIKVFISKNLPPPLNDLPTALEDILIEYSESSTGNFNYTFYDVTQTEASSNPEVEANVKLANDYGINANQVQTLNKDQIQLIKVYAGVVIEYGNLIERIPFVTDAAKLEYQITSILDRMNRKLNSLLALESPIEAKLYLNDEFITVSPFFQIQGLSGVKDTMEKIFQKANQENYGKINFSVVNNISKDIAFLSKNKVRIYPWNEFRSPDGKSLAGGQGAAALMLSYGDKVELVELLNPQASLQIGPQGLQQVTRYVLPDFNNYENTIDGIIDNLLNINDYIAYLDEKGTVAVDSPNSPVFVQGSTGEGKNFYQMLEANYSVEKVTLRDLNTKYKTLIIAGAKEEFSDYDLFLIDQYLMQGNSILFLQDSFKVNQVPGGRGMPTWEAIDNNLNKLLENYGVRIIPKYVMDKESFVSRGQGQNGGVTEQQIYFAPIIQDQNINHDFLPLLNLKTFIGLEMTPVETIKERLDQEKITATKLFSSSINSWIQTDAPSLVPAFIQPPKEVGDFKSSDLAYLIEGEFKSYFSDKPIPAKPDESATDKKEPVKKTTTKAKTFDIKDSDLVLKTSRPAKIIVVGSSALIKNNLIDQQGEGMNAKLAINLVDYLSGREDWTVMRTKDQRVVPLEPYQADGPGLSRWLTHRGFLKWFNMMGLPILVVLLGLGVYAQRSARRRQIARQFQQDSAE